MDIWYARPIQWKKPWDLQARDLLLVFSTIGIHWLQLQQRIGRKISRLPPFGWKKILSGCLAKNVKNTMKSTWHPTTTVDTGFWSWRHLHKYSFWHLQLCPCFQLHIKFVFPLFIAQTPPFAIVCQHVLEPNSWSICVARNPLAPLLYLIFSIHMDT